jgi:hypothetical protein
VSDVRAELGRIAREGLAKHLGAAGRIDRLLRLFADDRWLNRRAEDRAWDGYRQDVETAWDTLIARLDQVERPFAAAVRLALVRSTITSSSDLPVELLTAALRTGALPVNRVIAVAGLLSRPHDQAVALLEIHAHSENETESSAVETRLIDLSRLPSETIPALTLLHALPLLPAPTRLAILASLGERLTLSRELFYPEMVGRDHDDESVYPNELLEILTDLPEGPDPVLLAKAADALLLELDIEARSRSEHSGPVRPEPEHGPRKLLDLQMEDNNKAFFDPVSLWKRIYTGLSVLAPLSGHHPDPEALIRRVMTALSGLGDPDGARLLTAAYRPFADAVGIDWQVPSEGGNFKIRYANEAEENRIRLMREQLVRQGHPNRQRPGRRQNPFEDTLSEVQSRWLSQAAGIGVPRYPEPSPDAEDPAADRVMQHLLRVGSPKFLATMIMTMEVSDDELLEAVRPMFIDVELPNQILQLDTHLDDPSEDLLRATRRVKGALLRVALVHGARENTLPSAWNGIEDESLNGLDFLFILEGALALPLEEKRMAHWHQVMREDRLSADAVPRLAALKLILPYLDEACVGRAFDHVSALTDPRRRRLGLALLAPRLTREQVTAALAVFQTTPDALEQTWTLRELAARIPKDEPQRHIVEEFDATAGALIVDGTDFAEAFLRSGGTMTSETLAALQAMDHNDRLDAIFTIASSEDGVLPSEIIAEAMALPVVDDAERYPWRSHALAICADKIPADLLDDAWRAARELPRRLAVGDAEAWGWNWTYEYPLGAVALQFAKRPDGPHREIFEIACGLPWTPREEIFRAMAPHVDTCLAGEIFDLCRTRYLEYLEFADREPPFVVEECLVMSGHFTIEREVQFAEIIAAVAERLDDGRHAMALDQCLAFTNEGPRAWLPAKLLPHVPDSTDREPVLSTAFANALGFVTYDPGRIDLVLDLMPLVEEEVARRAAPLRAFLHRRFPGFDGLLLDGDRLESLAPEEAAEYQRLAGIDVLLSARNRDPEDLEDTMIATLLSPAMSEHLQRMMCGMIIEAPVARRAKALTALRGVVEPPLLREAVYRTLNDLIAAPEDGLVWGIRELVEHLEPETCDQLVAVAAQLSGPPDDDRRVEEFFEAVLDDFDTERKGLPEYESTRRNLITRYQIREYFQDRFDNARRAVHGSRVALLRVIADRLTPDGVDAALDLVASLPELERADGITVLLPVGPHVRDELTGLLFALEDPFARFTPCSTRRTIFQRTIFPGSPISPGRPPWSSPSPSTGSPACSCSTATRPGRRTPGIAGP